MKPYIKYEDYGDGLDHRNKNGRARSKEVLNSEVSLMETEIAKEEQEVEDRLEHTRFGWHDEDARCPLCGR